MLAALRLALLTMRNPDLTSTSKRSQPRSIDEELILQTQPLARIATVRTQPEPGDAGAELERQYAAPTRGRVRLGPVEAA